MKKLFKGFIFMFIAVVAVHFLVSCNKDAISETDAVTFNKAALQTNSTVSESVQTVSSGNVIQTVCNITGSNVIGSGTAVVNAGSITTYSYTNNTGTATSVIWTLTPNPIGSAILTQNGTTCTVSYLANFVSGTLSAAGAGGTAQTCNTVLNIKSTGSNDCGCLPKLTTRLINNNGTTYGSTRGEFGFENTTCIFNWSKVHKVTIQIGRTSLRSSVVINSNSYNNWTNTPTNLKYQRVLINNNTSSQVPAPGGLFTCNWSPGGTTEAFATIEFKNNVCPPKTLYSVSDGL